MKADLLGNARTACAIASKLRIDLYSDTNSRPTADMRKAMAEAECGNEQALEDPTTNALQERVAELLGKEAAVFLPSGTMCNEIAYRVWARQGDAIIMDKTGHALLYETGGPAALSGLMITTIDSPQGIFSGADVRTAAANPGRHSPRPKIVNIENTSNLGGGRIWPVATIEDVAAIAHSLDMVAHMDGARLMNAVVESNLKATDFTAAVDSVWIDFSKGLGCPIGGVLAGPADFINEAFRIKHQFGGALRQSGMITSACLYALDHHVERLREDHDNARLLHAGLREIKGITVQNDVCETNLVFFDVGGTRLGAREIATKLLEQGIRIGAQTDTRMRAVTHLDVSRDDIKLTLGALREILG
ncbi:MAG: GntG family PLP-dependent aldolase [Rhodospirillales bacterium]